MGNVRFISDLHLGHDNMAKRRGFKDAAEQDVHIISQWNKVVNKKDVTYILGDITMERDYYELLDALKGIKKVILGNHDKRQHIQSMLKYVNSVSGMEGYKKMYILTHCPIHPSELDYRFTYNIHGHVHENSITEKVIDHSKSDEGIIIYKDVLDKRYINVSAEVIDYTPKLLTELINE